MAICASCGREGTRVRTIFHESRPGVLSHTEDECPGCKPGSFDPRWLTERGAMGWEAYPEMYDKRVMPDGSIGYIAKDELRADTEAKIARESDDDRKAREQAIEHKRQSGRRTPLSVGEKESLIAAFRKREAEQSRQRNAQLGALASGLELVN